MRKNSLLATRPSHDITTRIISSFAEEVLEFARKQGDDVFDLDKEKARKLMFESMMLKCDPDIVFLNGHGDENSVTGQDQEILLEGGKNERLLEGKIAYALSCRSGKILGIKCVQKGAKAYIGYQDDFIFQYSRDKLGHPKNDKTAALFLAPSNQIVISLLKHHTPREAHSRGREAFMRNIRKLITSQTSQDDGSTLRYLVWDMQNLVCHSK